MCAIIKWSVIWKAVTMTMSGLERVVKGFGASLVSGDTARSGPGFSEDDDASCVVCLTMRRCVVFPDECVRCVFETKTKSVCETHNYSAPSSWLCSLCDFLFNTELRDSR